jgi:hypothetical protein
MCRSLGPDTVVLHVDYAISCTEGYTPILVLCSILVVLWPIGLPAYMYWLMYTNQELIQADDKTALAEFDFMVGDCKCMIK